MTFPNAKAKLTYCTKCWLVAWLLCGTNTLDAQKAPTSHELKRKPDQTHINKDDENKQ